MHVVIFRYPFNVVFISKYIFFFIEDLRHRDEKFQRLHAEFRNTMESIAILLSLPTRFVEAHESTIKDRIREVLSENKDKSMVSIPILLKIEYYIEFKEIRVFFFYISYY